MGVTPHTFLVHHRHCEESWTAVKGDAAISSLCTKIASSPADSSQWRWGVRGYKWA